MTKLRAPPRPGSPAALSKPPPGVKVKLRAPPAAGSPAPAPVPRAAPVPGVWRVQFWKDGALRTVRCPDARTGDEAWRHAYLYGGMPDTRWVATLRPNGRVYMSRMSLPWPEAIEALVATVGSSIAPPPPRKLRAPPRAPPLATPAPARKTKVLAPVRPAAPAPTPVVRKTKVLAAPGTQNRQPEPARVGDGAAGGGGGGPPENGAQVAPAPLTRRVKVLAPRPRPAEGSA